MCAVAPAGAHTCGATQVTAGMPPLPTSESHTRPHKLRGRSLPRDAQVRRDTSPIRSCLPVVGATGRWLEWYSDTRDAPVDAWFRTLTRVTCQSMPDEDGEDEQ